MYFKSPQNHFINTRTGKHIKHYIYIKIFLYKYPLWCNNIAGINLVSVTKY